MKIFSNFRSENDPDFDKIKKDLQDKPITFFYDYIPKNISELQINPYNFIMLHEPNEFFGMHNWVIENKHLFTGILTWNEHVLNNCDNAVLFHWSCNHFDKTYVDLFKASLNKKFEISFLSGTKNLVEGHKLRQEIYKIQDQIKIPKKWYYVLDDFDLDQFNKTSIGRPMDAKIGAIGKQILYNESMFNVTVENVNYNNWFTEKISDCFNTKTVPIYWGCPNILNWGYDERGIIRFGSIEELLYIINNLKEETYINMLPFIEHNYKIATNELPFKNQLSEFFTHLININQL
jgi:hypothetical protein